MARTVIHRRMSTFVDWVAPNQDKETELRAQANRIRERIRNKAHEDRLTIRSTPSAGSLAKRTGNRRHKPGGSNVPGYDIDVPFVVAPQTRDQEQLNELLNRFYRYAKASYPQNQVDRTKSSICLSFSNTNRSYDLVPMLDGKKKEQQILVRSDGRRLKTSVQKHVRFIKSRTVRSQSSAGRVQFNQCVRLMKWWRRFREDATGTKVPSFLVDLLAAHAFDAHGVQETYEATLAKWFAQLARDVDRRKRIAFADFHPLPAVGNAHWEVLDPVSPDNNVVASWTRLDCDELADWFASGRDTLNRAIFQDEMGNDVESRRHLIELFGSPFKHHCGA